MPLKGEQCLELFHVFPELHTRGGAEDDQDRALPCFFLLATLTPSSYHTQTRFTGFLIPW